MAEEDISFKDGLHDQELSYVASMECPFADFSFRGTFLSNPSILKATNQMVIATNFIDPGPLNYTSATTCILPRPSTLDTEFPSMVNAAPSTEEISHQ